ncbi:MAG: amino acid adenylation domain-containing protein, partial [Cytophagales bacterium]|nr:amino acid adenylation domain-containing protein [Cytophagales bacterium]
MDAKDIIIKLKDINASIEVVEGKIRLSGDQDMLSKELIDEVAKNKHKLISMLSSVVANKNLLAHDAEDVFPLTTTQRRFWILDKLMSNHSSYNMPVAWDINGALDHNALRRAFLMLAARHESLRTIVEEREDEPFQRVLKIEAFRLDFEYIDGSSDPEDVAKLLREYAADKFVLTKGPLFSVKVFRIADQNHVLFFNVHHICCDGWSFDIILKDIVRLYESAVRDDGGIEPLKYQYRDFVRWQIDRLNDKKVAAQKLFWAEYMSGDLKTLNLPLDRKRSVEGNFHGEQVSFTFSPQLFISLQSLCKKEGCTVFALLVAAVNVLFFRYSGNNDIVTGTPIAGRDRHEFFDIVGLFINTAVIRCKMQPAMPFRELLRNVWQDVMAISQNQDYPFDALVSDLTTTRDDTRNPLFDVLIMHRSLNTVSTKGKTDNGTSSLGVSPFKFAPKVSKLDMSLDFATTDSGLFVDIEFNSTLFDRDRIERMCMHLETLLQGIAEQPDMPLSHVPIIPFSEKILIEKFRGRKKQINLPDNLADLLRLSCETNGRRTALTYQSSVMSYDQLETLVSKQATWLRNVHGIRREDVVAVSMERSDKAFVTMLAIMRAGGIYLPIDRDFPVDRIQYILGDADAKLLIADRALVPRYVDVSKIWNEIESTTIDLIKDEPIPELAYLIYTSGSTGKPKGVLVGHAACLNAVVTQTEELELSNRDVVLQFASMSFDASVIEFFTALCAGSTIDIVPTELRSATTALVDFMKTRGVTFVTFPPSFLRSFPVGTFNFLGGMITAGERADHSIAVEYAKHIRYYNAYGPTEAAVCTTIHRVSSSDEKFTSISIGHPLYNCFVEIVDKEGLPLPVGCDGEMWISGIGLAKGYVKDEGKTNLNFVKGKDGTLRYHTGDIARWRSDGTIEFQGRNDHQVKIHGFRIEIEEVRVALLAIEGVRDSVVKVSRDELIAYYASDVGIEIEDIKDHLTKTLPRYMIPGNFVRMTSLPYNHSGKIDLDKLPAIGEAKEKQKLRSEDAFVEIWRQVLDLQDYTADENFFERGDSLSATRIRHKLLQELGIDVPLDHFFIYPTIREFISSLQSSNEKELIPIERAPDLQYYPLTAQQKRLWILSVTETSTAQYNISTFTTIHGKVIPDALRSAVIFLQERHEILRANFVIKQGEPYQFISSPNAQKTGFSFIDLSDHHEKVKELELLHNSHSTVEFNL